MARIIEMPDGRIVEIPDTLNDQQAIAILTKGMGNTEQDDSFMGRVNAGIAKRIQNIQNELPNNNLSMPLRVAGQLAGGVQDVGSEALKSVYKSVVPQGIQDSIGGFVKSGVQSLLQQQPGKRNVVSDVSNAWNSITPDAQKNIEAATNVASVLPIGALTKPGFGMLKEGVNIGRDVVNIGLKKSPQVIDKMIDMEVEHGIRKGVRLTQVGKSDASLVNKQMNNYKVAARDIVENTGELPQTVEEFSNTIYNRKKEIYPQYHQMAVKAGKQGAEVDISPIRQDLIKTINSKNVLQSEKDAAMAILNDISEYNRFIDPPTAESLISKWNHQTKTWWNNPDLYDSRNTMTVGAANQLRSLTDQTIDSYRGPGYQELKNLYGSLTAIEKEVTNRATVAGRANPKGFFDITDIAAAGKLIHGVLSGNPAMIAGAAAMKASKMYIKSQNNADNIVKNMFNKIGKLNEAKKMSDSPITTHSNLFREPPQYRDFAPSAGIYDPKVERAGYDELAAILTGSRNRIQQQIPWQDFEIVGNAPRGFDLVHNPVIQQSYGEWDKLAAQKAIGEGRIFEPYAQQMMEGGQERVFPPANVRFNPGEQKNLGISYEANKRIPNKYGVNNSALENMD